LESTGGSILARAEELAQTDSRIRVVCSEEAIGAAALNRACAPATREYCVFLGQQDFLPHVALHHMAEFLQRQTADLLYTDEDSVAALRGPVQPVFKPDWSPDLLLSAMYLGAWRCRVRPCAWPAGYGRSTIRSGNGWRLPSRPFSGSSIPS
jgi:hypothetical protein